MEHVKDMLLRQLVRLTQAAERTENIELQIEIAGASAKLAKEIYRRPDEAEPDGAEPAKAMALAVRRATLGMTQQQFADKLGVSRSRVAMWETGASAPRAGMLTAIADALHCSVDELLRDAEQTEAL